MTELTVPGALSKSLDIEKNYRAHKVFTEYERYRKKFLNDLNIAIDDTNYLVEHSNEVDAKKYLRPTAQRKRGKLPAFDLTPELEERFRTYNSRADKSVTYNPELAAKLLADTKKYTFRMAPINRTSIPSKKIDRYPLYHPKSIKNQSSQYIYFSENANSDQFNSTNDSFKKYSNRITPHQNTDEYSFDNNSNSELDKEEVIIKYINLNKSDLESNEEIIKNNEKIETSQQSSENKILQEADEILNSLSKDIPLNETQLIDESIILFEEEEEESSEKDQKEILFTNDMTQNLSSIINEDVRPSNCGNSPDGSSDFVMIISAPKFLDYCLTQYGFSFNNLSEVPQEEYEKFYTKGFNWIYFKDLPQDTNIRSLTALLHLSHLLILIDFNEFIDPTFVDGIIFKESITEDIRDKFKNKLLIGTTESEYADYFYDERPINCLRDQDPASFMKCIKEGGIERQRKIIRYVSSNGLSFNERSEITAIAMLLTLPGMRIIDFSDLNLLEKLQPLIDQKVIWNGVFEYVNFESNGNLCSWKYSRGKDHLLIATNFAVPQNTAHIICNDCPEVEAGEKKKFVDILTETKYFKDPVEVKTKGLCVILYEYEAQIFEY